jgi:hypothetical protein
MKPGNEKTILAGLGLIILGGFLATRNKKNNELEKAGDEIKEELKQGEKPTFPLSNYETFANQLVSAMFDAGTDETTIFNIFKKLKNSLDYLYLIKAFGKRSYYYFGINQGDYNLSQWLTEELSGDEINEINKILSSKGINYRV